MTIKEINELINKVVKMQSIEEIKNNNQIEFRKKLFEYFQCETNFKLWKNIVEN